MAIVNGERVTVVGLESSALGRLLYDVVAPGGADQITLELTAAELDALELLKVDYDFRSIDLDPTSVR